MFRHRSKKLERIDTGDYTPAEFEKFLEEIRFINQRLGDTGALQSTLLNEIEKNSRATFSVLDVGAGSGEMLKFIADFARRTSRKAMLVGLDLNALSAYSIRKASIEHKEMSAVQGEAFALPFADETFCYSICSLFTHHLTDENVVNVLREMDRVARRGIFVIDLHRHPIAFVLYKLFCVAYRISPLVRQDGSLSILRSFKAHELKRLADRASLHNPRVIESRPYRLILSSLK